MKLTAPTTPFFFVALVLAVVALLGFLGIVAAVAPHAFWLMTVAYVVLAAACVFKGI